MNDPLYEDDPWLETSRQIINRQSKTHLERMLVRLHIKAAGARDPNLPKISKKDRKMFEALVINKVLIVAFDYFNCIHETSWSG